MHWRFYKNHKGEFWAIIAAFSFAMTNVVLKWALTTIPPVFGAVFNIIPIWVITIGVVLKTGQCKKLKPNTQAFIGKKAMIYSVSLGIMFYVVGNLALFQAIKIGGVVLSTPIMGTQVVWAALFGYIFLKERINFPMALGMAISILGIILLTLGKQNNQILLRGWYLAVILATLAAICYSLGGALQRNLLVNYNMDKWLMLAVSITVGLIILHITLLFQSKLNYYTNLKIIDIGKLLLAGLFSASAVTSLTIAMSKAEVAVVIAINSSQTALAPIIAFILLKEQISFVMILGIFIALGGIWLIQMYKPKHST
jgi:drug/metabolite transporter (DMT)-like permease